MYGRLLIKRGNLDPQQESPEESALEAAWGSDGEKLSGKIHVTQKIGRGHAPPDLWFRMFIMSLAMSGDPKSTSSL